MAENILEVHDLEIRYVTDEETVQAVNDITFSLERGESIGLVGETGAGKTTTALGIMGLVPDPPGEIVKGSILFEGEDLLKLSEKQMRRIRGGKISMIFQDPMTSLNPVTRVGDQIAEVILLHNKISKAEARKRAMEMLEQVGIPGARCDDYPHQFSGGMKQRVMIAIALACSPELLIADEPTTALDVTIQAQVLELMKKLKQEYQTSLILITHDLGVVAKICDKVAVVYAGEIVESGTLKEIYTDKRHPYTIGLFDSLPDIENDASTLKVIQGMVPDPANLPDGCKFHPRCPYATEACQTGKIKPVKLSDSHMVRCNRFSDFKSRRPDKVFCHQKGDTPCSGWRHLRSAGGTDAGDRGRIRLRKVYTGPGDPAPASENRRPDYLSGKGYLGRDQGAAEGASQGYADHFPGSLRISEPQNVHRRYHRRAFEDL